MKLDSPTCELFNNFKNQLKKKKRIQKKIQSLNCVNIGNKNPKQKKLLTKSILTKIIKS